MSKTIDELKEEATSLGIEFSDRIGAAKLQERIDAFYEKDSEPIAEAKSEDNSVPKEDIDPMLKVKRAIAELERKGKETEIVKVTMVDRREASTATSLKVGNANMQVEVPLDVFVELPKLIISQIDNMTALTHQESGGTSVAKDVKKYVLEYKEK